MSSKVTYQPHVEESQPNHYKKAWSLVFKGVVWAEPKLLGVVLIISLGPLLETLEPMPLMYTA